MNEIVMAMINVKIIYCNHLILTFKNHNMHTVNLFGAKKLNASRKRRGVGGGGVTYNGVRKIHDLKNSYKYNLPIVRNMATGTSLEGLFDSSTAVAITSNPTNAKKAGAAAVRTPEKP